jgi:hypothetical protein
MSYKLRFLPTALKEWKKLDQSIKQQFKKKLKDGCNTKKLNSLCRWSQGFTVILTVQKLEVLGNLLQSDFESAGQNQGSEQDHLLNVFPFPEYPAGFDSEIDDPTNRAFDRSATC